MSVWITGDIHGNPIRLNEDSFYEQRHFSGPKDDNILFIAGDFGLVWDAFESRREKELLDWLESLPFTVAVVDGNHENHKRLASYPTKEWRGGKVHEIRPHVLHLLRGEIFIIENKKFFIFGGAASHDISDGILDGNDANWKEQAKALEKAGKHRYRVDGITWWKEELPSEEEMLNGIKNLEKHNNCVDYIITHSPPASVIALLGHGAYKQDKLTFYLENDIRHHTEYKKHYMGHMHINRAMNEKDILIYEQIIRIC